VAATIPRTYVDYHWSGVILTSIVTFTTDILQPAQFWSKSVGKRGHFTHVAEKVSRPYLDCHCVGETQKSKLALPARALKSLLVWSKSVSNEGHFSCGRKSFSSHLEYHCIGAIETSYDALTAHAQPAHVPKKWASEARHWSLVAETVLCPYLD
jgi:hypothetical protein